MYDFNVFFFHRKERLVSTKLYIQVLFLVYESSLTYALKLMFYKCKRSTGGVVVKLLACGARGPVATISEIGYILLPSRDMAERSLKRRKSSKQPTNNLQMQTHLARLCAARQCNAPLVQSGECTMSVKESNTFNVHHFSNEEYYETTFSNSNVNTFGQVKL